MSGGRVDPLGRPSLLRRLFGRGKPPLRLLAVPRDHVQGDRARGDQLLAGKLVRGPDLLDLPQVEFADVGTATPLAAYLQGFAWLRDLAAAASRDKGARLAEAVVARWLRTHGAKVDAAWAPALWGERMLFWTAYAPYLMSSGDAAYRAALLNTMARGARHLAASADQASPGLPRITAWAGLTTAALLLQGQSSRVAHAEAGLTRALATGQFDDGGLISRSPAEQALLVDRLGLLHAAYHAAKHAMPEALDNAATAALAALHGVTMGDGALGSWQGGNPGETSRLAALVDGCGLRARPLRQARGWGYHRLAALGTQVVVDAAPPPPSRLARTGAASTLAIEVSDGPQRLVVNCGGPGLLPTGLPAGLAEALRTTAAHSTLTLADTNSTALLPDGSLGAGVKDVTLDRRDDDEFARLEAAHDGYLKAFGLLHSRGVMLANDGKELRGLDRLLPKGRKKLREPTSCTLRFHLAPGVEAVATADQMGAILRSPGAPPWNFRCKGARLEVEESVWIDGAGRLNSTLQLAITGEVSHVGTDIGWQFRRSS